MGTPKLTKHIGSVARQIGAYEVVFLLLLFHCNPLHSVAFDGVDEASNLLV
jgi:hypothetical protein